jgi:hypothetical protein
MAVRVSHTVPNSAWINTDSIDSKRRKDRGFTHRLGRNINFKGMKGTELERRLVKGVMRRADSIGTVRSPRELQRPERVAHHTAAAKLRKKHKGGVGEGVSQDQEAAQAFRPAWLGEPVFEQLQAARYCVQRQI